VVIETSVLPSVPPDRIEPLVGVDHGDDNGAEARQPNDRVVAVSQVLVNGHDRLAYNGAERLEAEASGTEMMGQSEAVVGVLHAGVANMTQREDSDDATLTDSDEWVTVDEQWCQCGVTVVAYGGAVRAVESATVDGAPQNELSLDAISAEQRHDPDLNVILELLRKGQRKPEWDEVASKSVITKALWQQWNRLAVRNGALWRRFDQLNGQPVVWQLVISFCLRRTIFRLIHEGITGGHMGR